MYHRKAVVSILIKNFSKSIPQIFYLYAVAHLAGLEKVIQNRVGQKTMGFGAELASPAEQDISEILKQIVPQDLLRYGLIPEFAGRVPVIATLETLSKEAMVRILTEPKNALIKQYKKLFSFDDIELEFTPEALEAVAQKAIEMKYGRTWSAVCFGKTDARTHV